VVEECLELADAGGADLLLDLSYESSAEVLRPFRRPALIDIDPGLLQIWISEGQIGLARHDVYFSIGETVSRPGARFPSGEIEWHYTPPCSDGVVAGPPGGRGRAVYDGVELGYVQRVDNFREGIVPQRQTQWVLAVLEAAAADAPTAGVGAVSGGGQAPAVDPRWRRRTAEA
jgi:hypothetical protein